MTQAILGVLGSLVAAGIGLWGTLRARRPRRPRLGIVDTFATSTALLEPSAPPQTFGVELLDIDVRDTGMATQHPVVDIKLHNSGGAAVILKRLTVSVQWARRFVVLPDLLPYVDTSGPAMMSPSATYEIKLPEPEHAVDTRCTLGISHVIAAGEADRIHLRLITQFPQNETALHSEPGATYVYLLRLEFQYNANDQRLLSRPLGVACPGNIVFLPTEDGLRRKITRFQAAVTDIRNAIDNEIAARGNKPPDWIGHPPQRREDLPRLLSALNHRQLNDRFWDPQNAVAAYLDDAEHLCRELATTLAPDMPDGLSEIIPEAHKTLGRIPALRRDFGVPNGPNSSP